MLGKILPVFLVLGGTASGIAAGVMLKPAPNEEVHDCVVGDEATNLIEMTPKDQDDKGTDDENTSFDYVKLNNQFVVPVVTEDRVASLVVLSISLEVSAGETEAVYQLEPKVRDAFLSVLFDHANAGGFDGTFTNSNDMIILRDALREMAVKTLGRVVSDVLITDIVRQDV